MAKPDVTKWSVLSELKEDYVSNIKLFYVFGEFGRQVIIVTNDDNVYAFGGYNCYGTLGLGHKDPVYEPTKIETLCEKGVIDVQFGYKNDGIVLALTTNSEVFSWGTSDCGLLGVGNQTKQSLSPILIKELIDKTVIDIKCGERHCLALTISGELYYWGFVSKRLTEYKPKLMLCINGENIVSISCGAEHSMALTDDGKVYSWGDNMMQKESDDMIVINECDRYKLVEYPIQVNVNTISKIRCTRAHGLMLSTDGDIYSFGDNSDKICGERNKDNSLIKLNISNKFIDIGATKRYNTSVALSKDGYCYIWGDCGNETIYTPTKTRFNRVIDALECCSKIQVTFDRIYYENNLTNSNQKAISSNMFSEMFNKQVFSDTAFKIEDNYIYAHKIYLKGVCKHFEAMFSSDYWRECNEKVIEITQYSYVVYYAFIEYLYTNVVNIKPENAIELLDLANCYLEDGLKQRCVEIIKGFVSIENVFQIYSHAIQYKSEELREYCVRFFCANTRDKSVAENVLANYTKI